MIISDKKLNDFMNHKRGKNPKLKEILKKAERIAKNITHKE